MQEVADLGVFSFDYLGGQVMLQEAFDVDLVVESLHVAVGRDDGVHAGGELLDGVEAGVDGGRLLSRRFGVGCLLHELSVEVVV